jgi:hypothetical protein
MLDVTGSMCSPCTKIQAVQSAAKDLIDIVVWQDQSQYYSRVALAPFAERRRNVRAATWRLVVRPLTNFELVLTVPGLLRPRVNRSR